MASRPVSCIHATALDMPLGRRETSGWGGRSRVEDARTEPLIESRLLEAQPGLAINELPPLPRSGAPLSRFRRRSQEPSGPRCQLPGKGHALVSLPTRRRGPVWSSPSASTATATSMDGGAPEWLECRLCSARDRGMRPPQPWPTSLSPKCRGSQRAPERGPQRRTRQHGVQRPASRGQGSERVDRRPCGTILSAESTCAWASMYATERWRLEPRELGQLPHAGPGNEAHALRDRETIFGIGNLSGRGATVAHVLWEHEAVGSNPTAPTNTTRHGWLSWWPDRDRWWTRRALARPGASWADVAPHPKETDPWPSIAPSPPTRIPSAG